MFVPLWMIFLLSGTVMAVGAVSWAIRSRQFDEQERARFLPLMGLQATDYAEPPEAVLRRTHGLGYAVTAVLVASGVLVLGATLLTVVGG